MKRKLEQLHKEKDDLINRSALLKQLSIDTSEVLYNALSVLHGEHVSSVVMKEIAS